MALADAAGAIDLRLRQMMADRIAAQELARKAQLEQLAAERADRAIGVQEGQLGLNERSFEAAQNAQQGPMTVAGSARLVDPTTGRIITDVAPPPPDNDPITLSAGAGLIEPGTGRIIAQMPFQPKEPRGPVSVSPGATLVDPETGKPIYSAPRAASAAGGGNDDSLASLYSSVRGSRAIETIDELLGDTGWTTTGPLGLAQSIMPGSPGFDYASKLESLGSQIAQQELAQMRDASKTGGAVGQVSNFEQRMFMNALAPIQQGQSPKAQREGLERAKASLMRYRQAIELKSQGVDDQTIILDIYGAGGIDGFGAEAAPRPRIKSITEIP
jgi:hypothetical protein